MPPTAYGQKLDNHWHHASSAVTSAYRICLDLERQLIHQLDSPLSNAIATKELQWKLVNIRILGYLLTTGPSETAKTHIAKTILTENNAGPDAVIDRGGYYGQFFIRAFCRGEDGTAWDSPDSPPFYRDTRDTLEDVEKTIKQHPANYSEAKKSALVRDNSRCIVTRITDQHSYLEYAGVQRPHHIGLDVTRCFHIFAESMNVKIEPGSLERDSSADTWTIIRQFGYDDVYEELGGENGNIHRLENVMTLKSLIHNYSNNLRLWFEATATPNLYNICLDGNPDIYRLASIPKQVKFETKREDLPLPSPRYLEIHAAACRVAHMSGATDYYRELEDDDPYVAKFRSMDPVGSDFPVALHARLLDLSEQKLEQLSLDE